MKNLKSNKTPFVRAGKLGGNKKKEEKGGGGIKQVPLVSQRLEFGSLERTRGKKTMGKGKKGGGQFLKLRGAASGGRPVYFRKRDVIGFAKPKQGKNEGGRSQGGGGGTHQGKKSMKLNLQRTKNLCR